MDKKEIQSDLGPQLSRPVTHDRLHLLLEKIKNAPDKPYYMRNAFEEFIVDIRYNKIVRWIKSLNIGRDYR